MNNAWWLQQGSKTTYRLDLDFGSIWIPTLLCWSRGEELEGNKSLFVHKIDFLLVPVEGSHKIKSNKENYANIVTKLACNE